MVTINAKMRERLTKGIKKFQPILQKAKAADINESDTVMIITDMLCEIFGYDKFTNITSEFAIKRTFCDLAIKLNDKVSLLIECKAIGLALKDDYVRQATNYAADSGIEWVVLTNGALWRVYHIAFTKPIDKELVYEFDLTEINGKKQSDLEMLYYICIEAFAKTSKSTLEDLRNQKQILNRFVVGQLILSDAVLDALRRALKKMSPDIKPGNEELAGLISAEIFKREVLDGDEAADAKKRVHKMELAAAKLKKPAAAAAPGEPAEE